MDTPSYEKPFADLPAALVDEVLGQTSAIASELITSFNKIKNERESWRKKIINSGLVIKDSVLGYPPFPTTCGADGSYAIERLLSTDLVAAAAVAVEGLTPPSEKRHWDQPHHKTFIAAESHNEDTSTVLRAVMLGNEIELATKVPHDLVMIDGTLTLPIIYFNQALNKSPEVKNLKCSVEYLDNCLGYLESYRMILLSTRSDKNYIALPKYSTRRELGKELSWPAGYDDRGMLTMLLEAGELTRPRLLDKPEQEWHLNTGRLPDSIRSKAKDITGDIVEALKRTNIFYYKPHDWLPALRIEVSESIALNSHRLASVVQGIKHQCATASMMEPYPLYLADRTVKALSRSIPSFRQVTTQQLSEKYDGDIGEVFFAMHGYRSDIGR